MRYALGFCFTTDKKHVALIHKEKPLWQAGYVNGIGGKIEENESPIDCMQREFREETGVDINNWRFFCVVSGEWGEIHIFKAFNNKVWSATTQEEEKVEIMEIDKLPYNMMIQNLRWIIPLALDKDDVAGDMRERKIQ
jgi:8-oxo-dGTP diphosphatase